MNQEGTKTTGQAVLCRAPECNWASAGRIVTYSRIRRAIQYFEPYESGGDEIRSVYLQRGIKSTSEEVLSSVTFLTLGG